MSETLKDKLNRLAQDRYHMQFDDLCWARQDTIKNLAKLEETKSGESSGEDNSEGSTGEDQYSD